MKRLALILAALALSASVVLAGCNAKKKTETKEDPKTNPEQKQEEVKEDNNNSDNNSLALFAEAENQIATFEPKKDADKEIVAWIENIPFSASALKYAVFVSSSYPEAEQQAEFEKYFKLNAATWLYAEEAGVELPIEYINNLKTSRNEIFSMYGDNYESMFDPITPFFYYFFDVQNGMFANTFYKLAEDKESDFMKQINEETKTSFMENEKYVRVKHILIQFPEGTGENGALTDEEKAAVLSKANAVYKEATMLTDPAGFDTLVTTYNEDPGMTSYPGGYCFTTGEMVLPFEETAFALEDFEISEPVETDYGYHIIQKLPKDYEGLENTSLYDSDIYYGIASEKLNAAIKEKAAGLELTTLEGFEEKKVEYKAEYDKMMAEQQAAQNELESQETAEGETAQAAE